jgi:hypothetical protein
MNEDLNTVLKGCIDALQSNNGWATRIASSQVRRGPPATM